ncbi:hypothetical protein C9374_014485 [Naegleria lovaniensis]|uniref:CAF17 C-terminal domain-containing protein n=1 Tax=Naegleria lovaniensis TaxID=51637 RepID=A0AA88GXZ4_NAELO|nr:uncharacterized protein C9374_014485 [Naegleria lovaniensis]KAG2389085.1 hypothetical protein C9374_014485 [Naegleria lovaniensis]
MYRSKTLIQSGLSSMHRNSAILFGNQWFSRMQNIVSREFNDRQQFTSYSTSASTTSKSKKNSKFYTFCNQKLSDQLIVNGKNIVEELFSASSSKLCFSEISFKRSVLTIEGEQAESFIHSLVTSDVSKKLFHKEDAKKATLHNSQPSMFLNPKGRVLFDTILGVEFDSESGAVKNNNRIYIEHDASKTEDLFSHLKSHVLRKKVKMDKFSTTFENLPDNSTVVKVFALFGNPLLKSKTSEIKYKWKDSVVCVRDPRLDVLGYRMYGFFKSQSEYEKFKQEVQSELQPEHLIMDTEKAEYYERIRILCGIAENSIDIPTDVAFPMEAGFEQIGGIHFDKGCYIGQELTTRTYHRGEIRKRILIVRGDHLPSPGTELQFSGENVENLRSDKAGRMCSTDGSVGLALVKFEPLMERDSKVSLVSEADTNSPIKITPPYWIAL